LTTIGELLVADVVGESVKVVGNVCGHAAVGADTSEVQVRLGALMLVGLSGGRFELKSWVRGKRTGKVIAWKISRIDLRQCKCWS